MFKTWKEDKMKWQWNLIRSRGDYQINLFLVATGVDYQQAFRILNPHTQTEKFDKDCKYIKKYVEELQNIDNSIILNWHNVYNEYDFYINPIIVYKKARAQFLSIV